MRTHITLVGSQPIPVFIGVRTLNDFQKLDHIIFVHSEQTKKEAGRIMTCCESMIEGAKCDSVLCDPVNLDNIEQCISEILETVKDDDLTLDLTSGTKAWSLMFYRAFSALEKAKFFLVDQNNLIRNLTTHEVFEAENISNELKFALFGVKIKSQTDYSDYTDEDKVCCRSVEQLHKKESGFRENFTALTVSNSLKKKKGKLFYSELPDNPHLKKNDENLRQTYVEWDREESYVHLHLYNDYKKKFSDFEWKSPHLLDIVFNSGWFELKTAMEFDHRVEHVDKIWMNCEFEALASPDPQIIPKNEIDLIIEMGNRMFFVECKTQVFNTTDIDKFRSAIRNFSGTSSNGIFIVDYAPEKGNQRTVYNAAVDKCRDNSILHFCFSEWENNNFPTSLNDLVNDNLRTINKR